MEKCKSKDRSLIRILPILAYIFYLCVNNDDNIFMLIYHICNMALDLVIDYAFPIDHV